MSKLDKCPKCWEEELLILVDKDDWEENWSIDKNDWNYKELCEDCMHNIQIENQKKILWID